MSRCTQGVNSTELTVRLRNSASELASYDTGNSKSIQPKFSHDHLRIGRSWICMKYLWSYELSHNLHLMLCMASWLKPFKPFSCFCCTRYYSIPRNLPNFAHFIILNMPFCSIKNGLSFGILYGFI